MGDTLRYFFSAVFQGFAAIITLGIMFYLYYIDKIEKRISEIEKALKDEYLVYSRSEDDHYIKQNGIVKFFNEKVKAQSKGVFVVEMLNSHESIMANKKDFNGRIKSLFKIARVILIISLISLFCIEYLVWLDMVLLFIGVLIIILSIIFFSHLFSFIKKIID